MVHSVYDVEAQLNFGLRRSEKYKAKCIEWFTKYMLQNNIPVSRLEKICENNPAWVLDQIFEGKEAEYA